MGAIHRFERRDADGAPGAVHELHTARQELVDAVPHDRVRLAATDLHDHPGP